MALGSTQPLTEMNIRNLPGGKSRLACEAYNLEAICEPIIYKMWKPRHLKSMGLHGRLEGQLYLFNERLRSRNHIQPTIQLNRLLAS
jgi:hypothetical protein